MMWPFSRKAPEIQPPVKRARRSYEGANQSRLTAGFGEASASTNYDIFSALTLVRSRARWLAENNGWIRGHVGRMHAKVLGPDGMRLRSQAQGAIRGVPVSSIIELAWQEWTRSLEVSVDGKLSWSDIERIAFRTLLVDGEALIHKVVDSTAPNGIRLQLLEADLLPHSYDAVSPQGNQIRMGIELNNWGRPLAYWVYDAAPPTTMIASTPTGRLTRIPAENMIHLFVTERPGQLRGISWLATAIIDAATLGKMLDATLINARVIASKMGFLTQEADAEDYRGQGEDEEGAIVNSVEAGTLELLPPGVKFQDFDPSGKIDVAGFVQTVLRRMSAGIGTPYNALAHDLVGVNYSSLRTASLDEQDLFKIWQKFLDIHLYRQIFGSWINMSMLAGALEGLGFADIDSLRRHEWQGRRWAWVDPLKEVNAKKVAVESGFTSRQQVIRETGQDPDDVTAELEADTFSPASSPASSQAPAPVEPEETDEPTAPAEEPEEEDDDA